MLNRFELVWALLLLLVTPAYAADAPGVTKTEIKIGATFPFSGPASALGVVGKGILAYVKSMNDRGGINGRKVDYIALDDAYSPPKTVEDVPRLVERDEVAFLFGQLGTPGISATAQYLTSRGVPGIAMMTGSKKFINVKKFPFTTPPSSFDTEAKITEKYLTPALPNANYPILYQNANLGKDYVTPFRSFLKSDSKKKLLTAAYEITDPTADSQI